MNTLARLMILNLFLVSYLGMLVDPILAQQNRVELEVLAGNRVNLSKQQEWLRLLSEVGADSVKIRSANAGDTVGVKVRQLGEIEVATLTCQITNRNQLFTSGGTFGKGDRQQIAELIEQIKADGAEIALSEKSAFGMTSKQVVELHEQLGQQYLESTRGRQASRIIRSIQQQISVPVEIAPAARNAMATDYEIDDELAGLSCGTVLAAVTRPLGLVVNPERPRGGAVKLTITRYDQAEEHWPIGWPTDEMPVKACPKIFEDFSLRVQNYPLKTVMDAIEARSGVTFVYDYNGLAEQGIDLQTKVTLIEEDISYARALSKMFSKFRVGIRYEIRFDEAEQAFLWIRPLN